MGTLNLGAGAQFVGGGNGLSDAPTGTIIQTAITGSTSDITVNSDGSYTDVISINFTPRKSNSKQRHWWRYYRRRVGKAE